MTIAFVQLALAIYFYWMVRQGTNRDQIGEASGRASVFMSVRGCDPTLRSSLEAILHQDYPDYDVHVVVDHRGDSAWTVVHEVQERFDHFHRLTIHEMRQPVDTCGLKCNALVQALEHFDPETEYLILMDADVTPHETWLSEVTGPLLDPKIGVVTGNQWFEPNEQSPVGSLLRSLWNAGAIVPTAIFNNPWAGTFAMRMKDVEAANLAEVWRRSVVDDGPIRHAIAPLGLKIKFQPSLIMINREECTFDYVNHYTTRMLTWSKLYEKTFVNTVVHALLTNVVMFAALFTLLTAMLAGRPVVATIALCSILILSLVSALGYVIVRAGVDCSCRKRGEPLPPMSLNQLARYTALIPITLCVYGFSCFRAIVSQQVRWREITYEVKNKSQVRMLQYSPLLVEPEQAQSKVSL